MTQIKLFKAVHNMTQYNLLLVVSRHDFFQWKTVLEKKWRKTNYFSKLEKFFTLWQLKILQFGKFDVYREKVFLHFFSSHDHLDSQYFSPFTHSFWILDFIKDRKSQVLNFIFRHNKFYICISKDVRLRFLNSSNSQFFSIIYFCLF